MITIKKILLIIAISAHMAFNLHLATAFGETITLQWDPVEGVDGYRIFQAIRAGSPPTHNFDYQTPVVTLPATVTQWSVDIPGAQGAEIKYVFVARAYRADRESTDSNIVAYVVCMVPPSTPTDLLYIDGRFQWIQPPDEYPWRNISHWALYEEGAEVATTTTIGLDYPADPGRRYSVRAWRTSGVFSAESNIIIPAGLPPVKGLKVSQVNSRHYILDSIVTK